MQFGSADAIDLGAAFRAGAENNGGAALVETSGGILDLTLSLTFYTISFHYYLQVCNDFTQSFSALFDAGTIFRCFGYPT
jgi:hypothetical protein